MICSYLIFPFVLYCNHAFFFFRGKKLIFFVCRFFCLFKVKVQEHTVILWKHCVSVIATCVLFPKATESLDTLLSLETFEQTDLESERVSRPHVIRGVWDTIFSILMCASRRTTTRNQRLKLFTAPRVYFLMICKSVLYPHFMALFLLGIKQTFGRPLFCTFK